MDEVSSYVRLVPAVRLTARPPKRLFRLVFESHDGRALGADSEEKHEPVSDIDTAVADSLKVLDLKRPIREADISVTHRHVCFGPEPKVRSLQPRKAKVFGHRPRHAPSVRFD